VAFAGFAAEHRLWSGKDGRNAEGAENLVNYQKKLRRADLSLTHALIHPTIVRKLENAPAGQQAPLHKVAETRDTIVVAGSRALATLAPYADELAIWPAAQPLLQDGSDDYALSFAIPNDQPGLIYLCRDVLSAPGSDPFDRPLSTRFDEQDALVIFDNVEIPKERVFINCDREAYNRVTGGAFAPNIQHHTTVRALTKLEFAYGLAIRLAEAVDDVSDATIDMLGELLCYIELTRSALHLAEQNSRDYGEAGHFPDGRPLHPLRAMMAQWMPRAIEIIQLIGRHNLLATPSRAMLDDPRLRPLIDVHLATANDIGAEARTALFRLAWDFVGSGLGGRQELYERFYIGSAASARRTMYLMARRPGTSKPAGQSLRERADLLVDGMLG
jgi:aromatic ring hydroxylase